jgi:glycosyltransferase involved in cell wall biosynthesis
MKPRFSVVVRTRNRPEFFATAIDSVLSQTVDDIEVIVVEDGGDPYARRAVGARGDERVMVLRNDQSQGVGPATLRGVRAAHGRFIAFLDDDDWWAPTFLETLVAPLERDDSLLVAFCRRNLVDEAGAPIPDDDPRAWDSRQDWPDGRGRVEPFVSEALGDPVIHLAQSAVVRANACNWEFLEFAGPCWDNRITHQLCREGAAAWFEPTRLSTYRIQDSSMSAELATLDSRVASYRRYLDDEQLEPWRSGLRRRLAFHLRNRALSFPTTGDISGARRDLWDAVRLSPDIRSLRSLVIAALPIPIAGRIVTRYRRSRLGIRRREGIS